MTFSIDPFDFFKAFQIFALAFGMGFGLALLISLTICLIKHGINGPNVFVKYLGIGLYDFLNMSYSRILGIAILTWNECIRMKALYVFVIFAILFMFAGWFVGRSDVREDIQIPQYVMLVLTSCTWMSLLLSLLLACWGLPNDIRLRSIHTVVTKPVRKNEIMLGRLFGYTAIGTVVLGIMATVGFIWIVRQIPAEFQNQLISRVPIYGKIAFSDKFGNDSAKVGINVGDEWEFRSYIEGGTKARTYYTFVQLDTSNLKRDYERRKNNPKDNAALNMEYNFEAFRSFKGVIDQRLYCQLTLINPEKPESYAILKPFQVMEFSKKAEDKIIKVPEVIEFVDENSNNVTVNFFKDIIPNGNLKVVVSCVDAGQYLGMAKEDLYIRTPDQPFISTFLKSIFGIWMQMFLVILLSVTATCFVKGPVATLTTSGLFFVGQIFNQLLERLTIQGNVEGGGTLESFYRMINHMNTSSPLEPNTLTRTIVLIDEYFFKSFLYVSKYIVPDFAAFNMAEYTKNGFDVPWNASMLPGMAITVAYLLPCILLGYYSLLLREMEAK
jgi:hypothetical protein